VIVVLNKEEQEYGKPDLFGVSYFLHFIPGQDWIVKNKAMQS
jgi:hypothetical protein